MISTIHGVVNGADIPLHSFLHISVFIELRDTRAMSETAPIAAFRSQAYWLNITTDALSMTTKHTEDVPKPHFSCKMAAYDTALHTSLTRFALTAWNKTTFFNFGVRD